MYFNADFNFVKIDGPVTCVHCNDLYEVINV